MTIIVASSMIYRGSIVARRRAKSKIIDGHKFDSIQESARYAHLSLLQKAGEISELTLQPKFLLQPRFHIGSRVIRKMEYTSDFRYIEDGMVVIEEFKGFKREGYLMRKKLFLYLKNAEYDIFREVSYKRGEYIISNYTGDIKCT